MAQRAALAADATRQAVGMMQLAATRQALQFARALSSPGHASTRLARVLDTLVPDGQRKKRVLTLAEKLINERAFASKRPIDPLRNETAPGRMADASRRDHRRMGLSPVGTLVQFNTEELAGVAQRHPDDPFRPQVKLITDGKGEKLGTPLLTSTWDRDSRGGSPRPVGEAVDGPQVGIDPVAYL